MKIPRASSKLVRFWDWPSALLLVAALITATGRLSATQWTEYLSLVGKVALLGVAAGLALGQSRFSPPLARAIAFAYGLFTIFWRLGLTLGRGILWTERLTSLGNRMWVTADQLMRRTPVTDNLFFLFLMATLFWAISVYAGYNLTRHGRPWHAVLPAGLTIVVIHTYDSYFTVRAWLLATYLFFALMLVARLNFVRQHKSWKQNRSYLPPYLGLDFGRVALMATAFVVLLAWTAPALASALPTAQKVWQPVDTQWQKIRDDFSNLFSSLQASVGLISDYYGDTLELGRGNPLTDVAVLAIQSHKPPAVGVRYYWRARIYDHFDGYWSSTLPTIRTLTPDNFNLNLPTFEGRTSETFTFKTLNPIQNLFTPPQPTWVSRPAEASVAINADGTYDLATLKATPYLHSGEVYEVEASLASPTIQQLRAAGTDYPDWIVARYLQLPDDFTPRTNNLAKRLTEGLETPYDKVESVTNYLRENIEYSETIPLPPANREPIDWVLFNYRKAFCNYYATAEVLLLRAVGIPARLAVGYATGESQTAPVLRPLPGTGNIPPEPEEGVQYTVRHRDAHAWPEVYFPELGWVEFEPTASQAAIIRPLTDYPNTNPDESAFAGNIPERPDIPRPEDFLTPDEIAAEGAEGAAGLRTTTLWGGILLGMGLTILGVWRMRVVRGSPPLPVQIEAGLQRIGVASPVFLRRWARFTLLPIVARAYHEINKALSRLGNSPALPDTPAERAQKLTEILPVAAVPIQSLITSYEAITYGPHFLDDPNARRAGWEIRKQSYLSKLQRWFSRLQEPPDKRSLVDDLRRAGRDIS